MINKENVIGYIRYLLVQTQRPPLTALQQQSCQSADDIREHLSQFYQSMGIDSFIASQYEVAYIQATQKAVPAKPPVQPEVKFPANTAPKHPTNKKSLIIIATVAIIAIAGTAAFFLLNKDTAQDPEFVENKTTQEQAIRAANAHSETEKLEEQSNWSDDMAAKRATIDKLLTAENNREIEAIMDCFSDNMDRYWDIRYPDKERLRSHYARAWSKSQEGVNHSYDIRQISENEFEISGMFRYSTGQNSYKEVATRVIYIFDEGGKIKSTYEGKGQQQSNNASIDPNLITLSSHADFKWIEWNKVPQPVKENLKQIPYYQEGSYYDHILKMIKEDCSIKIAVTDLNNNGIYGVTIYCSGRYCCGSRGCSYDFLEDGGILTCDLGIDYEDMVSPSNNAVISSAGLRFPMKPNKDISSAKAEELKRLFRYK